MIPDMNKLTIQTVRAGYFKPETSLDERRPVRFNGKLLVATDNRTPPTGPNARDWHVWELYAVGDDLYVVVDTYMTNRAGKSCHTDVSKKLNAKQVAAKYPGLAGHAVKERVWREEDIAGDLPDSEARR